MASSRLRAWSVMCVTRSVATYHLPSFLTWTTAFMIGNGCESGYREETARSPSRGAKAYSPRCESCGVASDKVSPAAGGGAPLPLPFALDFYPLEAPEFTPSHPVF